MSKSDEHNLTLVDSVESVDEANSAFYKRFPYPGPASKFDFSDDPELYCRLVNQNLGAYDTPAISGDAQIWVAGCGVNQAVHTALRFPSARVIGTDLSPISISLSTEIAASIGLGNITLREENMNQSEYRECFDYIICTGVIHHNAEPELVLKRLALALKPSGILELMVYNRYHRLLPQALQKVIRTMAAEQNSSSRMETEVDFARRIIRDCRSRNLMGMFLETVQDLPEQDLADVLIQPVEYNYTVESLDELAGLCGMELVLPCPDYHSEQEKAPIWHVEFQDSHLRRTFESLPDASRWYVANLLLLDQSPMLWFYLKLRDDGRETEAEVNEKFLAAIFEPVTADRRCYLRKTDLNYELSSRRIPFRRGGPDHSLAGIYNAADGRKTMREIFDAVGLPPTFGNVLNARVRLSTSAFPFLRVAATRR